VHAYAPNELIQVVKMDGELNGSDILREFKLTVKGIFEEI